MNIKVPGIVWSLLLIAVIAFLQANFQNAVWYEGVIGILLVIAKSVQVGLDKQINDTISPADTATRGVSGKRRPGKIQMLLWG